MKRNSELAGRIPNSSTGTGIYVVREDNHQILYYNERTRQVVPHIALGVPCEEVFRGACTNCPLRSMGDRDGNAVVSHGNPFGDIVDISASRMLWNGEIPAFIITVSEHALSPREKEFLVERQNLYTAVSKVFPVLISVNLTRNTYSIMASEGLISHGTDREGKFDELVSLAASATHEEHRELFRKKFNRGSLLRAFAQGEREVHAETRQMGDDGVYHWVSTQAVQVENPYGEDVLQITLCRSIDEQKGLEARLKTLLEATHANMSGFASCWLIGEKDVYLREAGERFYQFFGLTPDRCQGGLLQFLPEGERQTLFETVSGCARRGTNISCKFRVVQKDGSCRWVRADASRVDMEEGGPVYQGVLTDVTHSMILQQELEQSIRSLRIKNQELEEFYHTIISGVAKIAADREGTLVFANDYFYEMTGYTRSEFAHSLENKTARLLLQPARGLQELFQGTEGVFSQRFQLSAGTAGRYGCAWTPAFQRRNMRGRGCTTPFSRTSAGRWSRNGKSAIRSILTPW